MNQAQQLVGWQLLRNATGNRLGRALAPPWLPNALQPGTLNGLPEPTPRPFLKMEKKMRFEIRLLTGFAALMLLIPTTAVSQVPDDKKSVIVFDIQLAKIRSGELYQKIGGDDALKKMQGQNEEVDLVNVDRVIGAFGYPKSVQDFAAVGQGADIPLEFFVRGLFADEATAKELFSKFERRSKVDQKDGRTYLRPKGDREPQNVSICQLSGKSIEIGTDGYVMGQKGRDFRTARLGDVWKSLPEYPVRIAIDAETAEALINEGIEMLGQQVPPQAAVMLASVKDISTIGIAIDIQSDPMLAIAITGKSEQAATSLANTLNGLLMMAKGAGQQASSQLPSPDMQRGAASILAALNAKQDGEKIILNIPRPEGFDEMIVQAASAAQDAAKAMEESNKMKMLGLAMHNYHAVYRVLPWETHHESQSPDLSWRVRLLPYAEEQVLYEKMDIGKAHDAAPNSQFADQMPEALGNPEKRTMVYTIGHDRMPKSFRDIIDGTANTIAMILAPANDGWLEPKNISIDDAIKVIRGAPQGEPTIVCLYDGAVIKLDNTTDEATLRAMMTYNGGEQINR